MSALRPLVTLLLAGSLLVPSALAADEGSAAPFGELPGAGASLPHPHAATATIRFRDVAEDALSVLGGMTDAEQAEVRRLVQDGNDLSAKIKSVRRSDHLARTEAARGLEEITRQLQGLHARGLSDRTKGRPFVAATSAASGWLQVGEEHAGFNVLRVSFSKPGNAWIMIENPGDASRPFTVTFHFFDRVGETTGDALVQSGPREELKPGEIRRVLAPIVPSHPRFWETTAGFTVGAE